MHQFINDNLQNLKVFQNNQNIDPNDVLDNYVPFYTEAINTPDSNLDPIEFENEISFMTQLYWDGVIADDHVDQPFKIIINDTNNGKNENGENL